MRHSKHAKTGSCLSSSPLLSSPPSHISRALLPINSSIAPSPTCSPTCSSISPRSASAHLSATQLSSKPLSSISHPRPRPRPHLPRTVFSSASVRQRAENDHAFEVLRQRSNSICSNNSNNNNNNNNNNNYSSTAKRRRLLLLQRRRNWRGIPAADCYRQSRVSGDASRQYRHLGGEFIGSREKTEYRSLSKTQFENRQSEDMR